MLNKLLNTLFPEACPVCNGSSTVHSTAPICTQCWESIKPYNGPKCLKCSKPLASGEPAMCGDCISNEPDYYSVRSFGLYEGALRKAINLFKYYRITRLAGPLAELLKSLNIPEADAVLPVPVYSRRLRQREFNQSALIAKKIADETGIPLEINSLIKKRDTRPQVGLSSKERKVNVRGAFKVVDNEMIKEKNLLLIDDVITTGATVRECAKVLRKANAGNIYVISLAQGARD